jgi:hypothetical protein
MPEQPDPSPPQPAPWESGCSCLLVLGLLSALDAVMFRSVLPWLGVPVPRWAWWASAGGAALLLLMALLAAGADRRRK